MYSAANQQLACNLISKSYMEKASNALHTRENLIKTLLSQRSVPEEGWDDLQIEHFLQELAEMDTNNFPGKVGAGEREGRVFSSLVARRNHHMSHGIGRSGDVSAEQPKAAGSSLVVKLTHCLLKDVLATAFGLQFVADVLALPLATGMALTLCLLALRAAPNKGQAKYVIWPRIDQKTCLKCIATANLLPVVVEGVLANDAITTNLEEIRRQIELLGPQNIVCVLSTTSCFAPRVPDNIEEIAKICKLYDVAHLVNNAYGLQCTKITNAINQASKFGRIDAVVQSTDKNFMVPVGGSVVFSPNASVVRSVAELYPGRASAGPITDLFITLLSMGKKGLKQLLAERKENAKYMFELLTAFAAKRGERLLFTPQNSISFALTLKNIYPVPPDEEGSSVASTASISQKQAESESVTALGSTLYQKRVMGARILIKRDKKQSIAGLNFKNYGSHLENDYPYLPYMTLAVAIGTRREEIDTVVSKLEEAYSKHLSLASVEAKQENASSQIRQAAQQPPLEGDAESK